MQPDEITVRYRLSRRSALSVDGVQHRPIQSERRPMQPKSNTTPPPKLGNRLPPRVAITRPFQIAPADETHHGFWSRLQLPLLIIGGVLAGFLVQSLLFGIAAIVIYSISVLALRIPSRVTFMLAFMSLITVVILLVVKPNAPLAGNFATYTFLLLVTGVIALAIEARPQRKKRRRPRNHR